jgi:penicillin-binding protein 1A
VASYSVFPNDGLRVTPRLIRKVSNADGIVLWEDPPAVKEVIDQPTARTMMGLLRAVVQHGTGAAAAQLNHPLGGKTGTTSDYTDAWFLGFSPSVTCGVWVGYDSNQSLGEKETGAKAALPIWMTVMKAAIAGKDSEKFLGDQADNPAQKAAALAAKAGTPGPAKPANPLASKSLSSGAKPATQPASGTAAKPVKANTPAKPPVAPAAAPAVAKPAAKPTVKPAAQPSASAGGGKPLVRPALPPATSAAKPKATVKPALENN